MAKIDLRLHARVMNRKQWDELDGITLSDEVQEILGKNWLDKSSRSLVIKKTMNYKGFLFITPFFEICDAIKYNVGDCLLIADYNGSDGMSGYLCEIGGISESEAEAPKKLLSASIENIEEWVSSCGKATSKNIAKTINSFYGEESDDYWTPSNDIVEMEIEGKKVRARVVSGDLSDGEEEDVEAKGAFDSLVDFSKTLDKLDRMQEKLVTDATRFVLTYNEGKIAKGPNYTMAIPDNFIVGKEKGRDFVAYLPEIDENGKPIKDITQAIVAVYPGIVNRQNNETEYSKSLEYYKAFSEYSYYIAKETMGALYEEREFVPVLCKYVSGGGIVGRKNSHYFYNINIYMNGESKMFRFDVKGARKETEDIVYKMVLRLLDGITPEEKPYVFVPANDESFIVEKVSKKDFAKWGENLDVLNKELNIIFSMYANLILKKRLEVGDIKKNQLKKECGKILKENAAKWTKHYEQVIDFIGRLSAVNKGNEVLINYYERAVELIDGNEDLNIDITDLDIKLQEVICDKKSTLNKLLTPEIKELLEKQGRNTNPEELRKQREIEKHKKEIEERKRAWAEKDKADQKGRQLISRIRSEYNSFEREFQSNANGHKRMIECRSFKGPWDPDLQEYFEMFGDDVEKFGSQVEELIKESLEEYNEINSTISAEVAIDIVGEIENLIDEVNDTSIGNEQLGIEHTYTWGIDDAEIKAECRRLKQELRKVTRERQREREKQEKEDRDFEEAIKYGVEIKDLPKHRIYVNACQLKKKAKTSADYMKVQKEFDFIEGYLDSDKLRDQCSEKATKLKKIEKAQREFDETNKSLATVSKEFTECEEKIAVLEKELEVNTSTLTKKQDLLDANISGIEKKCEKQLAEIDAEIENLKNQESNIKSTKAQKETELANTFFLAFWKKNRLREEIAALTNNLVLLSKSISGYEHKKLTVKQEAETKIKKLKNDIYDLTKVINNQRKSLAELKEELLKISSKKDAVQITFNEKKIALDNLIK